MPNYNVRRHPEANTSSQMDQRLRETRSAV